MSNRQVTLEQEIDLIDMEFGPFFERRRNYPTRQKGRNMFSRSSKAAMLIGGSVGIVVLGLSGIGLAGVTGDLNTTSVSYGPALATQTINTGFGDSNYTGSPNGPDANGSELDAAYGVVSGGNLNLFLAGNFENNGNHVNVFIADGRPGQSVLNTSVGPINSMNGSVFSPGFSATYVLDSNDYQGTMYTDVADLFNNNGGYQGAVGLSAGIGNGTLSNGILLGLNNSNTAGVNGAGGTATNPADADAVTTGLELAIPLSLLGNPAPGSDILVMADINGGGNGYLSNQFLPGLPVGTGNVGGGGPFTGPSSGAFNFGATPGEYFAVTVPEPTSMCLIGGAAMLLCVRRRKA